MAERTIHSGFVMEHDYDYTKTYYYTDDKDALPPDLRNHAVQTVRDFSWTRLMDLIREGEATGNKYVVQIGDMYYETIDE